MRAWGVRTAGAPDGEIVAQAADLRAELREAYRRGREDEHRRHRRSPLVMGSLIVIAAVGAAVLYFAAQQGSFAGAGQVVDARLNRVTTQVIPGVVNDAADKTGTALQAAGARLKTQGAAASARADAQGAAK